MMEMLTNYDYTIDVTLDADGEAETWRTEAGYDIISVDQMLGWVAANCQASCPGHGAAGDPHIFGLRGQRFDVSGVDGGWYCMLRDEEIDLQVNVRFTAPLPIEFPHRQLITAVDVLSNGHFLAVEVRDPYDTATGACPDDASPCLLNGGMKIVIDGKNMENLLGPTREEVVVGNTELSATNLPMKCWRFGGDRVWAQMYVEMLDGRRDLRVESFEEWILRSGHMAARVWCAKYISERDLSRVQSNHAVLKIATSFIDIRLNVRVNHQGGDDVDYDRTPLPELDFSQMDLWFEGMSLNYPDKMSGILGETARLTLDDQGREVVESPDAFRDTIEDYRGPWVRTLACSTSRTVSRRGILSLAPKRDFGGPWVRECCRQAVASIQDLESQALPVIGFNVLWSRAVSTRTEVCEGPKMADRLVGVIVI